MPGTAGDRHANVADRFDWRQNIDGGARYFAYLVDRYHGDLARASAAYNGGAGHVDKTAGNGVPSRNSGYVESVVPGWTPGTTQRFIAPGYPGGPPLPGPDQSAVVKPPAAPASPPPPTGIMGFMRRLGEMPGARADSMYSYGILNTVPANRIWPSQARQPSTQR